MKKVLVVLAMVLSTVSFAGSKFEQFENGVTFECNNGHEVILTKRTHCFKYSTPVECFDYVDAEISSNTNERIYSFHVYSNNEKNKKIVMKTTEDLDFMIFPDVFAQATIKLTINFNKKEDVTKIILSKYAPFLYKRILTCNVK